MRFLLTVQYLGTRYAGWQTQANATGVQQVLEKALSTLCGCEARLEASGRTDSGVHARAQRAHVDLPVDIPPTGLVLGVNNLLPSDIRVSAAERVADDFHARFTAREKTYVYQIWNDAVYDVFHRETFAHVANRLDEAAMAEAAGLLVGHHDFRCFTVAEPEVSSTWRTVTRTAVERQGREIFITVAANGFLRYMVRRIAGSLIEAGKGNIPPADLAASLEPDFKVARWTAPAHGLVLDDVKYTGERA